MKTHQTQLYPFDNESHLDVACQRLADGQVVAAPTDTVYGLMASLNFPSAIEEIYKIKERPFSKAIPILLGDIEQIEQVAQPSLLEAQSELLQTLTERWWPGPLTLILPANPLLPDILTAGQSTVAIRIPDHPQLRQLMRIAGPLAATSANLSGYAETTTALDVLAQLEGRISVIFDGGPCMGGMGSTIVSLTDLSGNRPQILRDGPLAAEIKKLFDR